MHRRHLVVALALLSTAGFTSATVAAPADGDAASGIREALERGASAAVALLGRDGGFLDNPRVRIELPGVLRDAAKILRFTGQQGRLDTLVAAMNRAAEAAVPEAKALLVSAVRSISLGDAARIVRGGETAVTDFFATKTRAPLSGRFLPIVKRETDRVDLASRYNALVGQFAGKGGSSGAASDRTVEGYVTRKALDGLYLVIGDEEKKIRRDPIGTGSAVLQRVFGR